MNLSIFFQGAVFIFAVFCSFYLPAKYILDKLKLKLSTLEDIFFTTTFGFSLFSLVTYILSWANIVILIYPMLIFFIFLRIKEKQPVCLKIERKHFLPLAILASFVVCFSFTSVFSGEWDNTIRLVESNKVDSLWHLSLINAISVKFPPDTPGFSGIRLKGYHFFSDFLIAQVSRIFMISPMYSYFQFFPLLISFLWSMGVYVFMYKWSGKITTALWSVFFTMFGGSFGFIVWLQGHREYSLDDVFGITQPYSSLVNPPFAISIVIITAALFGIFNYLKEKNTFWLIPTVLLIGIAPVFKVYAGIILFSGFIALMSYRILRKRVEALFSLLGIGILFSGTYLIFSDSSAKLIWAPFWAPHKVVIEHLPWYGYEEKQYTYSQLSVIKGLIEIELFAFFVFIGGSLGTRLVGILIHVFDSIRRLKKPSTFSIILLIMLLVSIGIPLFFIQSIQVFDIIQMAWYFLFFSALFAAFGFGSLFNSRKNIWHRILLVLIVGIVTLPSAYEKINGYLSSKNAGYYSSQEYNSLLFLKNKGTFNDIVLELAEDRNKYSDNALTKWYRIEKTMRISAFANKQVYLHKQIDFPWLDMKSRIEIIQKINDFDNTPLESKNYKEYKNEIRRILKEENIAYIYSHYSLGTLTSLENLKLVFSNEAVYIYSFY